MGVYKLYAKTFRDQEDNVYIYPYQQIAGIKVPRLISLKIKIPNFFLIITFLHFFSFSHGQSIYEKSTKTYNNINDKKSARLNFKSLVRNDLVLESLTENGISDLYWYIKQECYFLRKQEESSYNNDGIYFCKNGSTLVEFAKSAIKLENVSFQLKLEMLQFLEQQKRKPVLLSQNLNYIVLKYDLDIKYNYFTLNKNNMTNDEIKLLANRFEEESLFEQDYMDIITYSGVKKKKNDQIVKLSSIQLEMVKRDSSTVGFTKLIELMEIVPKDNFHYFIELNYADLKAISEKFLSNHDLALKYSDLLIEKNEHKKSIEYLYKIKVSPHVKIRIFRCKKQLEGMISATEYLMAQKPKSKNWNNIMSEATLDISSHERYDLINYLYKNYKKSLDTLDFTIVFGFRYINLCQFVICEDKNQEPIYIISGDKLWDEKVIDPKILEENYQFITKVLKEFDYIEEADYFKRAYWKQRILTESNDLGCGPWCYEVINKYVKQGHISKSYGSSLIYDQAKLILDGLTGRGVRGTPEFEKPYRVIIDLCTKSIQMDPNNALNYKLLGDVYSFLGDGNKNQYYYKLAANKGVYMDDRQRPGNGKGNIRKGARGGKYYINSNGNKTYVN
jgi:hypothetical protein